MLLAYQVNYQKTFDLWPQLHMVCHEHLTFDPIAVIDTRAENLIIAAWTYMYKRFAIPTLRVLLFSYCPCIIMPRCACASEVYGSVFVCLCVCLSV